MDLIYDILVTVKTSDAAEPQLAVWMWLPEHLQGGWQVPVFYPGPSILCAHLHPQLRGFLRRPHKEASVKQQSWVSVLPLEEEPRPIWGQWGFNVKALKLIPVMQWDVFKIFSRFQPSTRKCDLEKWKKIWQRWRWRGAPAEFSTFPGRPVQWPNCFQAPQGTRLYDFLHFFKTFSTF